MSERGAQRFRGGWKLDGNAAAGNEPGDVDVEIAGVGTQVTTKCPITQQTLVHPVRSSRCKHVYERDAIADLLRKHKGKTELKCPVSGCSERVGRDELERSRSTEAAVKRASRRAGSQRAAANEDEDLDLT
jgi:SUMO ligase MMS21 Smc5/6 complex component